MESRKVASIKGALTAKQLKARLESRLERMFAQKPETATDQQLYEALASEIRDILSEQNRHVSAKTYGEGAKQVYYMSMEFLVGRSLRNNLINLGIEKQAQEVIADAGVPIERIYECEPDPGLGNGGLGRLAACYLDGLATCGYPATGYSILYEYGIFHQKIIDGWQREEVDNWLPGGRIWLEEHPDEACEVRLGGEVEEFWDDDYHHIRHTKYDSVIATPYDMFISGYGSAGVSKLRLWKASTPGFDMDSFNRGDFATVMNRTGVGELISKVLYPNDNHMEGKLLRMRQQYFLCCASINDIVQKHLAAYGTLENLPDKVAIHINDTHPTLAIPELIRVMLDECGYGWKKAVDITRRTFSYTNHTILMEALEQWDADILHANLPRIYQIIMELDKMQQQEVAKRFPGDYDRSVKTRIVADNRIHMANLCIYMSHCVTASPSCTATSSGTTSSPTTVTCSPANSLTSPTASPTAAGCCWATRSSPTCSPTPSATALKRRPRTSRSLRPLPRTPRFSSALPR